MLFLDDRRKALEDAFFAHLDDEWRQRHRAADEARARRRGLSAVARNTDDSLLDQLAALGFDGSTLVAIFLVPVVMMAWADGRISDADRKAVLTIAAEEGIDGRGPSAQVLEHWLAKPPPHDLMNAWADYIQAASASLSPAAREGLKSDLLEQARRVAEASGGFLGFAHKLTPAELAVMARLEKALST
ncbi:hypothetical protein [Muricoccus radiodurans]|uniref:hypothetical protein n=1 Tax=Muricoccus radiodurans TaxID=2231721 RepID=UPI003CEC8527